MDLEIKVKIKPFSVPNFVIEEAPAGKREEGFREAKSYPIGSVDAELLSALCDQFRRDVFAKAKKADPVPLSNPR